MWQAALGPANTADGYAVACLPDSLHVIDLRDGAAVPLAGPAPNRACVSADGKSVWVVRAKMLTRVDLPAPAAK
jgi:hypothetical protein